MRKLAPIGFRHFSNALICQILAFRQFWPSFLEALGATIAAYAEARVDVGDTGITLHVWAG